LIAPKAKPEHLYANYKHLISKEEIKRCTAFPATPKKALLPCAMVITAFFITPIQE
jgi:hypothetical protein